MTILILVTVSAEGRVENQKLNQTAALLSFGWVFGFQLDLLKKNLITLTGFTFTFIRKEFFIWDFIFLGVRSQALRLGVHLILF